MRRIAEKRRKSNILPNEWFISVTMETWFEPKDFNIILSPIYKKEKHWPWFPKEITMETFGVI